LCLSDRKEDNSEALKSKLFQETAEPKGDEVNRERRKVVN